MQALRYLPSTVGAALAVSLVVGLAAPVRGRALRTGPPGAGHRDPVGDGQLRHAALCGQHVLRDRMKQGWFEDVGIKIGPEELGLKVTDTNVIALLLNGQLDMSSQYCPLLLPTYKSSDKLKCVAFTDNFLGTAILAGRSSGSSHSRTISQKGKISTRRSRRRWRRSRARLGRFSGAQQAAVRGGRSAVQRRRVEPRDDGRRQGAGARQGRPHRFRRSGRRSHRLHVLQAGWTNLVDIGDLYEYGPGGMDSPVEKLVAIVGIAGNTDFLSQTRTRCCASCRGLAHVRRGAEGPLTLRAAGAIPEQRGRHRARRRGRRADGGDLHPYSSFEDNEKYFVDEDHILYWKKRPAIIGDWTDKGRCRRTRSRPKSSSGRLRSGSR